MSASQKARLFGDLAQFQGQFTTNNKSEALSSSEEKDSFGIITPNFSPWVFVYWTLFLAPASID